MKTTVLKNLLVPGLVAVLWATPGAAEDEKLELLPDTQVFRFNAEDRFYEKRKYTEDFRIKGVEISDKVYFGEAKIAGEKGPGIVVERGDFTWGFNHKGAEVLFRF